jgi:hypothetical protein
MITSRFPEPRSVPGWIKAVAAAAGVLVVIGGVGLFRNGGGPVGTGGIVRLALTQDVPALGGVPEVVNSSVSTDGFDPLPDMTVWQWGDTGAPATWLVETRLDADLTALLGPSTEGETLHPPAPGPVETLVLADVGWYALSWQDSGTWHVAFGFDETAVAEIAERLLSGIRLGQAELRGDLPVLIDPRRLIPGPPVELSELFYSSPAGGFSVALFRGWPYGVEASLARIGDEVIRIMVNGEEAVTFSDEVNSWVMWTVDGGSTGAVESSDLDIETLIEVAESVTSVSLGEWRVLTGIESADLSSTTPPLGDTGFAALEDSGVVHLTIAQLRDVSEIWGLLVGVEVTDPDSWGRRVADACMLGVWNVDVAELLATEYVSQDLGRADDTRLPAATEAIWSIAASICPEAFPEGALEAGPPSARQP